jgi:phospholipid/cholesterol/gamma-HCH transport system ATP-binding protein
MDIARGRVTAVMGPSGTGKTTLLRLITGQVRADSGTIEVAGEDMRTVKRDDLYVLRRRMGMLFQNGALLTDLSVFENVAFPLREHTDLPERLIRQLVLTKLQAVGLRGAAELMPAELSGGMSRRVALARAIVMDPEILIYDEPFAGLDPISMGVVLRLIRRLNNTLGLTSIVVSHDVKEVSSVADNVFLLSGGKVVASGTPQALTANTSEVVRQFMGGLADGPVPFHFPAPDYFGELLARGEGR